MPVTALLTGIFALMMVALSAPVSLRRWKVQVAYGDGGDRMLGRLIRAHGNFAEYAPLMLIVLAMVEIADAPPAFVWPLAAVFLASRTLHALGALVFRSNPWTRAAGMLLLHGGFLAGGLYLLLYWRP
jgi:uncharacterized protein